MRQNVKQGDLRDSSEKNIKKRSAAIVTGNNGRNPKRFRSPPGLDEPLVEDTFCGLPDNLILNNKNENVTCSKEEQHGRAKAT